MIRVAILGAGIGGEHLAAYQRLPEDFEVVMICDKDTERAQKLSAGIPVLSDIDAVLSMENIDLIDICLPPHLHVPIALEALAAGKHVICEKPLALSLADVTKLEAASKAADRHVFPVFQYRFGQGLAELHALMESGLCGDAHVATLETHWDRDAAYYSVPWRGTLAAEGGGAVLGHAIHIHDLMTHLLGPVANLSASHSTRVNPIETEDCAAIRFEMASGALVTSSVTLGAAGNHSRLRFVFEHLTAESGTNPYAPAASNWTFTARDPARQSAIDACVLNAPKTETGFTGFLREVAKHLTGQNNRAVTLEDGKNSVELVTALYLSSKSKTTIPLPLPKDHPGWRDLT